MDPKITRRGTHSKPLDPAKIQRATGSPDRRQVEIGRIGFDSDQADWPEDTPAWIRWEQGEPLAEVAIRDGDKITARIGVPSTEPLSYGQQVVVVFPDGDPQLAVIVATLCDSLYSEPSSVCGVETGAGEAVERGEIVPAATWQFMRLTDGRMLAIQTQGADVLIWSGASVHIRCSSSNLAGAPDGAIHLDGRVALGVPPLTAPTGSSVAPGGDETPGVSAQPYVALPYTPPAPVPPLTLTPYQGKADGIVRAHDMHMSTIAIDPAFWAWVQAVSAALIPPLVGPAVPTVLHSAISGVGGPGSKHTATGDDTPI